MVDTRAVGGPHLFNLTLKESQSSLLPSHNRAPLISVCIHGNTIYRTAISVRFLLKIQSTRQIPLSQTWLPVSELPPLLRGKAGQDYKAIYLAAERPSGVSASSLIPRGLMRAQDSHSSVCITGSVFQKDHLLENKWIFTDMYCSPRSKQNRQFPASSYLNEHSNFFFQGHTYIPHNFTGQIKWHSR